ncbi:hypothetical protein [Paramicrobacterium chengjingii]|uniref:hypothetical protein n=1 Tax=Paramicrobacterium chengjingii TaxID=2769067 RepID=UPI0014206AD4|nr:hypothetical protein [Microbacterium chengjingii]
MNDLAVRAAELADAEQIAGVHVRSWQTGYFGLIDQEILDGLSIADRADFFYERHGFHADGALKRDERPDHTLFERRRVKNLS